MEKTFTETNSVWNSIKKKLNSEIKKDQVLEMLLEDVKPILLENNSLTIMSSSKVNKSILNTTYLELINEIGKELFGVDFNIQIISADQMKDNKKPNTEQQNVFFKNCTLNKEFTFENFIHGVSNQQAYNAALSFAENKNKRFNPLYIYSESGLGKTHLLQAIANYIKVVDPSKKVLYVTANQFFEEYISFIRGTNKDNSLNEYLKSLDVLLIDDIQSIKDNPKCQDFLFNPLSTLLNSNKLVAITSDVSPEKLRDFSTRLTTRFESGLTISIEKPDLQTSIKILKKLIFSNSYDMDLSNTKEEVFTTLASTFSSSVRELEGIVNNLLFYVSTIYKPGFCLDLNIAKDALSDKFNFAENANNLTPDKIINIVSKTYKITESQIIGSSRQETIALARHIAMYLIRNKIINITLIEMGAVFGNRHHTTIMNGVEKIEKRLKVDKNLQTIMEKIEKELNHSN